MLTAAASGGQSAVQRLQSVEGGANAGPQLLLPGESVPGGHLPLPDVQQERGTHGNRIKGTHTAVLVFLGGWEGVSVLLAQTGSECLSCPHGFLCALCQLGSAILEAVEQNMLSVEPVGFQPLPVVKASAVECGGPK